MPKENKTKYAILGVLNAGPCSGYDIKKFCDNSISHFWNENFGHIYPVLKLMEKEGLITKNVEQNEGKPPRNVYSITTEGRDAFTNWLVQPVDYHPARSELLLKLSFGRHVPMENIMEILERDKQIHVKRLEELLKIEEAYVGDERNRKHEGYPYWLASLRCGIYSAQFRIKWCEETMENIKAHKKTLQQ